MADDGPSDSSKTTGPEPRSITRRKLLAGAGAGVAAGGVSLLTHNVPATAQDEATPSADTTGPRFTRMLDDGWKFVQDDDLTDDEALAASGDDWQSVSLPHTWNAKDAASLTSRDYKRGLGWYRLTFDTPTEGARHWLEFGAASLVADVWLNGDHLGQHKGGFTAFRFDITGNLADSGENVLLVKANNSAPEEPDDVTAIDPLSGDFNICGGLYRYVSLISLAESVHFDLADSGGPGVYATTTSIAGNTATVRARARVKSDSGAAGDYVVRVSLVAADGAVAGSAQQTVNLEARGDQEVEQDITVSPVRLWHGRADPYLYQLVADLVQTDGTLADQVTQSFGIRQMAFDPDRGFFLNGEHVRWHGVAMHQDYLGKAWAQSNEDWDTSFDLIMEIGANAVRFGHYPFPQYAFEKANELGLVVWVEKPNGQSTSPNQCSASELPEAYVENAKQQLTETILQLSNHACVAVWCVGNETTYALLSCDNPVDTVRPYLRAMHERAKELDPSRPTAYAEYAYPVERSGYEATEGITDLFGTNRYFLWYTPEIEEFSPLLDGLHTETAPGQPLGVTEYGIGSAMSHHTDNPEGGYPDVRSAPEGQVSYQPVEYASWAHEQNYRVLDSKDYLFGAFVWNMFDFGSSHRNEGDVLGVNTKGLVTFDRQDRKSPFFFYKANWSDEPVTFIESHRYTNRAYAVNDVRVFSNADSVELSVNDEVVGSMTPDEYRVCVFPGVRLKSGDNRVVAVGSHGAETTRDELTWTYETEGINIAAGRLPTGEVTVNGDLFGSDDYFRGGGFPTEAVTPSEVFGGGGSGPSVGGTADPALYEHFRMGRFGYEIPLDNGVYQVRLGFLEPDNDIGVGDRVFDVTANGETVFGEFDIRREAGGTGSVVTRTFAVEVAGGRLDLQFVPIRGDALVSNIMIGSAADAIGDREYLVSVLTTTAEPVLQALTDEKLHERLPVRGWEGDRADFSPLEAFARTLAGVAPWIELGADDTPEGLMRAHFIDLARQSLINATDPNSPDFMTFDDSEGDQPLVEGAYLASALMSAPVQLWAPLSDEQKGNVLDALRTGRGIENTHNNNWWLFPAMIEAALWSLGADYEISRIATAVDKMEGWYLGDGTYGDGPEFHWDYYNSFVIHPMLLQVLRIANAHEHPVAKESWPRARERALRYAEVLERLISPEGTFPVIGRSAAYRFATMYHLSYMALNDDLPEQLDPGAVRSGITEVVRHMFESPETFDKDGWLQLGAVGYQPGLQEDYNSTGSLYVCLTGLVFLGLPAIGPFWTAPDGDWTQKRIWSGQDVPRDRALRDRGD